MANSLVIKDKKIRVGDTIKIHYDFKDKDKTKTQIFMGILMSIRGKGNSRMITVRKMTKSKIGVERIFPVVSPHISKIEQTKKTTNTRAKIRYIRNISEREIRDNLYT